MENNPLYGITQWVVLCLYIITCTCTCCIVSCVVINLTVWSLACSVGRVTGRLPRELGDEVVLSLLECFGGQPCNGGGAQGAGKSGSDVHGSYVREADCMHVRTCMRTYLSEICKRTWLEIWYLIQATCILSQKCAFTEPAPVHCNVVHYKCYHWQYACSIVPDMTARTCTLIGYTCSCTYRTASLQHPARCYVPPPPSPPPPPPYFRDTSYTRLFYLYYMPPPVAAGAGLWSAVYACVSMLQACRRGYV